MSACAWPLTFSLLTLRENVSTDRASEGGLSVSEPTAVARQTRPPRFGEHGARAPLSTLPTQCSLNTPSTARSSAGLISLEGATVTENSGASSFSFHNERKSLTRGKIRHRSEVLQ